jgi:4-carboxymuconolactone decarboxylase
MEIFMKNSPRLPYLKRDEMSEGQQRFYDDVVENMGRPDLPHVWMLEDGQINGPFTSMLHYPKLGYPLYKLQLEVIKQEIIDKAVMELFILVVVTDMRAAYGMYAHSLLAEVCGLERGIVDAVRCGRAPEIEDAQLQSAYRLAKALTNPGPVAPEVYRDAIEKFGDEGYNVLVNSAAFFKYIGTLMNAYDEPVPR